MEIQIFIEVNDSTEKTAQLSKKEKARISASPTKTSIIAFCLDFLVHKPPV